MFTDMVGYSRLTQENESLAIDLLEEHREILREIFPKYSGREIDTAGDAFFVEYDSALAATMAAIEIQTTLHERNLRVDSRHAILLRIGLHLGDVIHVGEHVRGDGVNIAARMEPLARPGSICVSEDIARQVHNKIDLRIAPLGRRRLKNIRVPVEAYRIVMPWEEDHDITKVLHAFSTEAKRARRRSWVYWAVAVIATVTLLWVAVRQGWDSSSTSGASPAASVVAVLPFSVRGNPDFAYLGHGMVDLLSTKLDGAGDLRAVDPRAILGKVDQLSEDMFDPESGRKVADWLGAGSFVLGNITEASGRLQIDAGVYPAGWSRPREQGTVLGNATDIFNLVDRLATQLLVLDRSGPGAPVERLEQVTTTSFDALKHYLQGVRAFRAARFQLAADELQLAVEKDSSFALAWYQLSSTAEWLFDRDLTLFAARQALRHKDHLSERGRRLAEALYAGKLGRNREALRLYREFLSSYPDDVEAWYQLGELQFHAGHLVGLHIDESLTAWERLLHFEPNQITALIHSARIALANGDLAKVDSMSRQIFELEPAAERNIEFRTHLALREPWDVPTGSLARQLRAADEGMLAEVIWSLGAFRDHPAFAAAVTPFLTDVSRSDEARGLGHVIDGYLLAAQGRFDEAGIAFDRAAQEGHPAVMEHTGLMAVLPFRDPAKAEIAAALAWLKRWDTSNVPESELRNWYSLHDDLHEAIRDYLVGVLEAMAGNHRAALETANRLDGLTVPPEVGAVATDFALAVRAEVARQQGTSAAAEDLLNRAGRHMWYQLSVNSSFASQSRERFILGLLLEERGRLEEAISAMSFFEGYSAYDWIYVAPSHLRRAMMYDELGEHREAAEHYRRFVTLWSDCDDEFRPAVEAARERLAELGEEGS